MMSRMAEAERRAAEIAKAHKARLAAAQKERQTQQRLAEAARRR
jgi:crossover junction endodeoxyribonuclease RuvC